MADAAVARGALGLKAGREIDQLALGLEAVEPRPIHAGDTS